VTLDVLAATASKYTGVCDHEPTVLGHEEIYNSSEEDQRMFFGKILTMEEKDDMVKSLFKKEYWPDRLKEVADE
jgi:hypothetical protein